MRQAAIDKAFRADPRASNNVGICRIQNNETKFYLVNGKQTKNAGVIEAHCGRTTFRVTNVARTLIDCAVRSFYGGEPQLILQGYRTACQQHDATQLVEEIVRLLPQIGHKYPYHQAIGFYFEKASPTSQLAFFFWPGKEEAVWWIAAHSTLLAAIFVLAALHCWISWRQNGHWAWYGAAILSFWLACCSKNEAVAALPLFLLLDAWFATGSWKNRLLAVLPLLALGAVFVGLEWHAAHIFARQDPHYNASGYPLGRRVLFVFWFLDRSLNGALPIYPLDVVSLFLLPLAAGLWRVGRNQWNDPDLKKALIFSTLFFVSAAVPVPFSAGFIALGSRFAYIPALGLSLAIAGVTSAVLRVLARHNHTSRETTLSACALALAFLLPATVIAIPSPILEMEASALMVMALGAMCWIALRCQFLDGRVAATLFFAVLLREIGPYLPSEDLSLNFWQFVSCVVIGLLWKREVLTGTLLAFAMWQNPYFAALLLAARAALLHIHLPKILGFSAINAPGTK